MPRKSLLYFLILFVGAIYIGRLFFLQVLDSKYRQNPLNNSAVTIKYAYPDRGFIYDRNDKLLVANQSSYDIMIIPKDVEPLDTLEFCNLLKITKEDFIKKIPQNKKLFSKDTVYICGPVIERRLCLFAREDVQV